VQARVQCGLTFSPALPVFAPGIRILI
jgi:hypothetical protein